MIDIKKFMLDVLKERIDDDIKFQTGKRNEEMKKSIYIENIDSNYKNMYFSQNNFKQDLRMTINWSDDYTETRNKALEIYNIVKGINLVLYDENTLIIGCRMLTDFPADMLTDNVIYSQMIEFQIRYCTRG